MDEKLVSAIIRAFCEVVDGNQDNLHAFTGLSQERCDEITALLPKAFELLDRMPKVNS